MKRTSRLTTAVAVALAAAGLHAGSFTSDFSNPAQTGLTLIGGTRANGDPYPAIANGVLAITYAEGSLNGTVILDDLDAGKAISGFTMNFKVRIGGGTSDPADGISIYFGSDLQGTAFGEEGPDGGQGLVVCFDTFNNGDNEAPAIDVKYAGNLVARVPYTAGNLQSDTFSNVSITLKSNGTLDLVYKGQTVHSNLLIPGYTYGPGQFAFGARTGGAWSNHWIDDLSVSTTVAGAAAAPTVATAPASATVNEGGNVTFTASPGGTPPFQIQWLRNGQPIADATGLSYSIAGVAGALNGSKYSVRFSNAQGEVTSPDATLTVNPDVVAPTVASVSGSESFNAVTVRFSEPVTAASAGTAGNYSIPGLTISGVTVLNPTSVRLTTSQQTPGSRYTLTINNVADVASVPNTVAAGTQKEFGAWVLAQGFVKFESFLNIAGTPIQGLLDDPKFQANAPDASGFLGSFDSRWFYPTDATENYGARITGWFTPPSTGSYRFFSRSDDASQLFLSSDANPANLVQIAEETGCCNGFLEPGAAQTSEPVALVGGQRYYLQFLYKEGGGGDYGQVAFRNESDTTASGLLTPIAGSFLSTYANPDAATLDVTSSPASLTGSENTSVRFSVAATGTPAPLVIQWQRAEPGSSTFKDIAGATGAQYATPILKKSSDDQSQYRALVRVPGREQATAPALLTVIIDTTPPSIVSAVAGDNLKAVTLSFSEDMLAAGLATAANYTVSGVAVSAATAVNARTVRLTTSAMAEGAALTVTASGIKDSAGNLIVAPGNAAAFTSPLIVPGVLKFEAFTGIGGASLNDLRASAKYPNSPDAVRLVQAYELGGFGDNYGARIKGFFTPTVTGDYVAYMASDDGGELYLSTDDSEANKRLVAVEPVWANSREWVTADSGDRRPETAKLDPAQPAPNVSLPIRLVAGQRYYTELVWKEGGGGDHGAAKFVLASETPENGSSPTAGAVLSTAISPATLAALSLPTDVRSDLGSGGTRGFKARVHQVNQIGSTGLPTFIYRAEQQLAGIIDTNSANLSGAINGVFNVSGIINWNQDAGTTEAGNFRNDSSPAYPDEPILGIPGLGKDTTATDNIAGEVISYLEFSKAGVYFMGVNSDDGFAVYPTDKAPANNMGVYVTVGGQTTGFYAVAGGTDKGGVFKPITAPLTGKLVLADPLLADAPLKNADAIKGNIAVIDRGVVTFSSKVTQALNAGAIGVIMVNNRDPDSGEGKFPIVMGGAVVDLPAVMVSKVQGAEIKALAGTDTMVTIAPDTTSKVLGSFDGGRGASDTVFAFNVTQPGLYPMRLLWFEGGGGANLEWFTVTSDGTKVPINDPSNPNAIKAYQTRTFTPGSTVSGNPPAGLSGATLTNVAVDAATKTITADVPAGSEQGYLTISPAVLIKSVEITNGKLVIKY